MKVELFERELKTLINFVRAYGIQHMKKDYELSVYTEDEEVIKEFFRNVHKGFYLAQRNCVKVLKKVLGEKKKLKDKLKRARQEKNKERIDEIEKLINRIIYQEMVIRKVMDSIVWQIFNQDLSVLRRFYYGQELIDITDSNLESELKCVESYSKRDDGCFVLISDMTSFVQIGDVVIFTPGKEIIIGELKEGEVNEKVFKLIDESIKNPCPQYLAQKLSVENSKFREHFKRSVKQIIRNAEVNKVISGGEGKDLFAGLNVKICEEEIVMNTFCHVVENLLEECNKKGYAISVLEECLLIGVYRNDKFSDRAFDVWAKSLNITMPVVDFRQSFFDPLGFPLFLQPLSDQLILDIVTGRKVIKFTIDINRWLETFKEDGVSYRWMSKKETARINSQIKGKSKIFSLDGCGVEFEDKNGYKINLGEGAFSRMFTSLNNPSSIKKYLLATMDTTSE